MLTWTDYLLIFTLGSLGGFLSGFLGVGGGIIYIPILDYFLRKLGMHDEALVKGILANSLFTIIFSGSVASYKQYKAGNFFPKQIFATALPGIVTAMTLTWLIRNGSWYSKKLFNYVFATMLLVISLRMLLARKPAAGTNSESGRFAYGLTGLLAGVITAMSGLGGGMVMTPIFTDVLKQNIKKASSISNGVIPLFAIVIGIYNLSGQNAAQVSSWQVGYIVLPAVLPMIAATFIFAPLGVNLSHRSSQTLIRSVFALFASVVFLRTLYNIVIS